MSGACAAVLAQSSVHSSLDRTSADQDPGVGDLAPAPREVKALHWLLRHGAVAETRDPNGDTALSFAARAGHLRAVEARRHRTAPQKERAGGDERGGGVQTKDFSRQMYLTQTARRRLAAR